MGLLSIVIGIIIIALIVVAVAYYFGYGRNQLFYAPINISELNFGDGSEFYMVNYEHFKNGSPAYLSVEVFNDVRYFFWSSVEIPEAVWIWVQNGAQQCLNLTKKEVLALSCINPYVKPGSGNKPFTLDCNACNPSQNTIARSFCDFCNASEIQSSVIAPSFRNKASGWLLSPFGDNQIFFGDFFWMLNLRSGVPLWLEDIESETKKAELEPFLTNFGFNYAVYIKDKPQGEVVPIKYLSNEIKVNDPRVIFSREVSAGENDRIWMIKIIEPKT